MVTDKHYEHWLVASSYLAYGGALSVVRADDSSLQNSFVGTATSIKIKSLEHYEDLGYDENPITGVRCCRKKSRFLGKWFKSWYY